MRLWKLEKLADRAHEAGFRNRLIIHICELCKARTPIPPKPDANISPNPMPSDSVPLEITDNLCDRCNNYIIGFIQARDDFYDRERSEWLKKI